MMNKTVIMISEDNHGFLAIADCYESAIDYLFNNNWITSDYDTWDGLIWDGKWIPATEYFNTDSLSDIKYELKTKYNKDTFNNLFQDYLYLSEQEVYTN